MDMNIEMEIPIALIVIGVGYIYKDKLLNRLAVWSSWTVDKYVELKWTLTRTRSTRSTHSTQEQRQDGIREEIVEAGGKLYLYRDKVYIMPANIPILSKSEIDQSYDGETITNVTVYRRDGTIENGEELRELLAAYAGPLCDFHGQIPSLQSLHSLQRLQSLHPIWQEFASISKIIVNTDCLREYVIT